MSYSRDRDAHTRWPGASASLDRSRAHRIRRARALAAFEAYDRSIVNYAFGAISAAETPSGSVRPGYEPLPPVTLPPVPPPSRGGVRGDVRSFYGAKPAAEVRSLFVPTGPMIDPAYPSQGSNGTTPPTKRPPKQPKTGTSSPGAGVVTGGKTTTVTGGGYPVPPHVELVDPEEAAPASSSKRNWLILAAVLGGAWLLLRDSEDA